KALAIILFTASGAAAQPQIFEVWVASTGNDANTCYRTTPCATFNRALAAVISGGVIRVIDTGSYGVQFSPITITKSVTIDGGGFASTLAGSAVNGASQFTVSAGSADVVVIRNFAISAMRIGV